MTDFEFQWIFRVNYEYLLVLAENLRLRTPEHYPAVAEVLEQYREFVRRSAKLDDLPEVPM